MTRRLHAAFEFAVALGAAVFFLANLGGFLAPGTHPQWRAMIALSLFVALVAFGCFVGSVRHIRREGRSKSPRSAPRQ
jgi:hypothetical protein